VAHHFKQNIKPSIVFCHGPFLLGEVVVYASVYPMIKIRALTFIYLKKKDIK
jgi:hypothetical protein